MIGDSSTEVAIFRTIKVVSVACVSHIKVTLTGNRSKEVDWEGTLRYIAGLFADDIQTRNLLIDMLEIKHAANVFTDYLEVKLLHALGFYKVPKIAVLDSFENEELNGFMETASYNQGIRIRFFYSDENEAISWLDEM